MANILSSEKQAMVIGALAEGNSIRSIERMTGIHRDTIMRLGVRVGQGCAALLDSKMTNLSCQRIEVDEIWGFEDKGQFKATCVLEIPPVDSPSTAVDVAIAAAGKWEKSQ